MTLATSKTTKILTTITTTEQASRGEESTTVVHVVVGVNVVIPIINIITFPNGWNVT
jgi:hypothetical protein